jgi:hypothetical protein
MLLSVFQINSEHNLTKIMTIFIYWIEATTSDKQKKIDRECRSNQML